MNEYLSKEGLRQLCIKIRKALQRVPNDNLLDNWYFVGGGSQLGWGHFPINQRGQVEYAANGGYAFDRWKLGYTVSAGKVMITPEGVKLIRNTLDSGVSEISQVLRFAPKDMVTLSILSADNELTTATGKLGVLAGGNSKNGLRFATTTDIVRIRSVGVQELTLVAAMLEPGTEQHLAHKEGGKWVLNRVPDYGEELRKCKNYQVISNIPENGFIGRTSNNAQSATVFLPLPTTLRADALFTAKSLELIGNGHSVILNDVSVMMATGSNGGWIGLSGDFSAIGADEIVQGMAYYGYSIDANP